MLMVIENLSKKHYQSSVPFISVLFIQGPLKKCLSKTTCNWVNNLPSSKVLPGSICSLFKDFNSYVSCRTSSDCIQHFHHERAFGINRAVGDLQESKRGCKGAVHQPCNNLVSKSRWILIAELMLTWKEFLCQMVYKDSPQASVLSPILSYRRVSSMFIQITLFYTHTYAHYFITIQNCI